MSGGCRGEFRIGGWVRGLTGLALLAGAFFSFYESAWLGSLLAAAGFSLDVIHPLPSQFSVLVCRPRP